MLEKQTIQPNWYPGYPTNGDPDSCLGIYQDKWFNMPCNVQLYCGICKIPTGPNFILRGKYLHIVKRIHKCTLYSYDTETYIYLFYFFETSKAYALHHHWTSTMDGQEN